MAFNIGNQKEIQRAFTSSAIPAIEKIVRKELVKELTRQGHIMTGALRDSIEFKSQSQARFILINGFFNDYGIPINSGVKPSRIPYSPGSGKKTSKYIDGLVDFVKKKRIETNDKKALGIAFAIAKTQKKEGQPTKGSFKHSKNGRRSGWVDFALEASQEAIGKEVQKIWSGIIRTRINNFSQSK
jgi:hypothetical protein